MSHLDLLNQSIEVLKNIDLSYETNAFIVFAISFSIVLLFVLVWKGSRHEKLTDKIGVSIIMAVASVAAAYGIEDGTILNLNSTELVAVEEIRKSIGYIEEGKHTMGSGDISRSTIRTLINDAEKKRKRLNNLVKMLNEIDVSASESELLALESTLK